MTSTNDGKEVKSNQSNSQKGKTYFIELYKSLDSRLSGDCAGVERTQCVCEAWRRIHSLCSHSASSTHSHLLAWLQRHTASTVLQTEWTKCEDQHALLAEAIDAFLADCASARSNNNGLAKDWEVKFQGRAKWFQSILSNPWGHPVLKALIDSEQSPSDQQIIEWLKEERGVMFVTRLRQMAALKSCADLALRLATAVMQRSRLCIRRLTDIEQMESQNELAKKVPKGSFVDILSNEAGFTAEIWEFLTDLEFVLLHKATQRSSCIELAKQVPLRDACQLVERLKNRPNILPKEKKVWKNGKDVALLIAQVVITRCMVVPMCRGAVLIALYGCSRSIVRMMTEDQLSAASVALAAPAATAHHLHTMAAAVHKQLKGERTQFTCQLYVRAITAGMNELEKLKLDKDKSAEARFTEKTLSTWFKNLGTLLCRSSRLKCECVLTAFSVHPSPIMYEEVKNAPHLEPIKDIQEPNNVSTSEFGSWATDSRTQTNFVKTSETLNIKKTQKRANVLSTAILSEGEGLGLSSELCNDLAVLLSGPRVKTLSWDMEREALLENCRTYMKQTDFGTRALTTELKYLNLDPRSFQHLPEEEDNEDDVYYGIEKGYEHLVELQDPIIDTMHSDILQSAFYESPLLSSDDSILKRPKKEKKKKKKKLLALLEDPLKLETEFDIFSCPATSNIELSKGEDNNESSQDTNHGFNEVKFESKPIKEKKRESKVKDTQKHFMIDTEKETKKDIGKGSGLTKLLAMKTARKNSDLRRLVANTERMMFPTRPSESRDKMPIQNNPEKSDVVFDGLFSVDDMNFQETQHQGTKFKEEAIKDNRLQTQPITNVTHRPSLTSTPYINNSQPINATTIKEQTKKNIEKLLTFRRNNVHVQKKCAEQKDTSAEPMFGLSANSKSIIMPRSGQNKLKHLTQIPNIADCPNFPNNTTMSSGLVPRKLNNMVPKTESRKVVVKGTFKSTEQKAFEEFIKSYKTVNVLNTTSPAPVQPLSSTGESQFQEFLRRYNNDFQTTTNEDVSKDSVQQHPKVDYDSKSSNTTDIYIPSVPTLIDPTQRCFREFLNELQGSVTPPVIALKENPDPKSLHASVNKLVKAPKKAESVPNTFSRLSYLHKNKQMENKLKLAEVNKAKTSVSVPSSDLNHMLPLHLQRKGQIQIRRIRKKPNGSELSPQSLLPCGMKSETTTSKLAQFQSNVVHANVTNVVTDQSTSKDVIKTQPSHTTTMLSDIDRMELLQLLRQKNKLNASNAASKSYSADPIIGPTACMNTSIVATPAAIKEPNVQNTSSHNINRPNNIESLNAKEKYLYQPVNNCISKENIRNKTLSHTHTHIATTSSNVQLNTLKNKEREINDLKNLKLEPNPKLLCKYNNIMEKPKDIKFNSNVSDQTFVEKQFLHSKNLELLTEEKNAKPPRVKVDQESKLVFGKPQLSVKENSVPKKQLTTPRKRNNNPKIEKSETKCWESVFNDLLKHKTPSRGPTALEMALHKNTVIKKCASPLTNNITETTKSLEAVNKNFTVIQPKEVDPFISGIPNSDYDLLDELMDDDLRQEIRELSDDDTYCPMDLYTQSEKVNIGITGITTCKPVITQITEAIGKSKTMACPKSVIISSKPISGTVPSCNKPNSISQELIKSPTILPKNVTKDASKELFKPQKLKTECSDRFFKPDKCNIRSCIDIYKKTTSFLHNINRSEDSSSVLPSKKSPMVPPKSMSTTLSSVQISDNTTKIAQKRRLLDVKSTENKVKHTSLTAISMASTLDLLPNISAKLTQSDISVKSSVTLSNSVNTEPHNLYLASITQPNNINKTSINTQNTNLNTVNPTTNKKYNKHRVTPRLMLLKQDIDCETPPTLNVKNPNTNSCMSINMSPVYPTILGSTVTTSSVAISSNPSAALKVMSNETNKNIVNNKGSSSIVLNQVPKNKSVIVPLTTESKIKPIEVNGGRNIQCEKQLPINKLSCKTVQKNHNSTPNKVSTDSICRPNALKIFEMQQKLPFIVNEKSEINSNASLINNNVFSLESNTRSNKNIEQIKKKRLSLLNRQIHRRISLAPIALPYESLNEVKSNESLAIYVSKENAEDKKNEKSEEPLTISTLFEGIYSDVAIVKTEKETITKQRLKSNVDTLDSPSYVTTLLVASPSDKKTKDLTTTHELCAIPDGNLSKLDNIKNSEIKLNIVENIPTNSINSNKFHYQHDSVKSEPNKVDSMINNVSFVELQRKPTDDPSKRFVKVKVNGTVFIATISGHQDFDIDSLFADPQIRNILLQRNAFKTPCKLKVNQKIIFEQSNSKKTIIKYNLLNPITETTEVIDLVSDDESEGIDKVVFKTEFGKFVSQLKLNEDFPKHQKRFSEKCIVDLNRSKLIEKESTSKPYLQLKNEDNKIKKNITDVIEIDDSSNDSAVEVIAQTNNECISKSKLPTDLDVLRNSIIKGLNSEALHEIKNTDKNNLIKKLSKMPFKRSRKINTTRVRQDSNLNKLIMANYMKLTECFVKLVRCDFDPKLLQSEQLIDIVLKNKKSLLNGNGDQKDGNHFSSKNNVINLMKTESQGEFCINNNIGVDQSEKLNVSNDLPDTTSKQLQQQNDSKVFTDLLCLEETSIDEIQSNVNMDNDESSLISKRGNTLTLNNPTTGAENVSSSLTGHQENFGIEELHAGTCCIINYQRSDSCYCEKLSPRKNEETQTGLDVKNQYIYTKTELAIKEHSHNKDVCDMEEEKTINHDGLFINESKEFTLKKNYTQPDVIFCEYYEQEKSDLSSKKEETCTIDDNLSKSFVIGTENSENQITNNSIVKDKCTLNTITAKGTNVIENSLTKYHKYEKDSIISSNPVQSKVSTSNENLSQCKEKYYDNSNQLSEKLCNKTIVQPLELNATTEKQKSFNLNKDNLGDPGIEQTKGTVCVMDYSEEPSLTGEGIIKNTLVKDTSSNNVVEKSEVIPVKLNENSERQIQLSSDFVEKEIPPHKSSVEKNDNFEGCVSSLSKLEDKDIINLNEISSELEYTWQDENQHSPSILDRCDPVSFINDYAAGFEPICQTLNCSAEWSLTKHSINSYFHNIIYLNDSNVNQYSRKDVDNSQETTKNFICDTDWFLTKSSIHAHSIKLNILNFITGNNRLMDKKESIKPSNRQCHAVLSLFTIMTNYFGKNAVIVDLCQKMIPKIPQNHENPNRKRRTFSSDTSFINTKILKQSYVSEDLKYPDTAIQASICNNLKNSDCEIQEEVQSISAGSDSNDKSCDKFKNIRSIKFHGDIQEFTYNKNLYDFKTDKYNNLTNKSNKLIRSSNSITKLQSQKKSISTKQDSNDDPYIMNTPQETSIILHEKDQEPQTILNNKRNHKNGEVYHAKIKDLAGIKGNFNSQNSKESFLHIKQIHEITVDKETLSNTNMKRFTSESPKKNITLLYKGDDSNIILKGSPYKVPVIGTCYLFPIHSSIKNDVKAISSDEGIIINKEEKASVNKCDEVSISENNFNVLIPKITYSKQEINNDLHCNVKKNLKRKSDCLDPTYWKEKRYRKGKCINCPKVHFSVIGNLAYAKEFKALFEYWRSIKFSFSRPFHKEHFDVHALHQSWPIQGSIRLLSDKIEDDNVLFGNEVKTHAECDPLQQTLSEEIASGGSLAEYKSIEINENNFSMGFGEGSDRVIQQYGDQNTLQETSAATLSDVKHQPLKYEYSNNKTLNSDYKYRKYIDEIDVTKRFLTYIKLKNKVRSYFKKTNVELNQEWMTSKIKENVKNCKHYSEENYPFDVHDLDFFNISSMEAIVQVVQVGQLPVSAAAQNPVTCDPRVTQVTDASPPQCSAENSPRDSSQPSVKTEYTELTTADLSLPLVEDYERQNNQTISLLSQSGNNKLTFSDENIPIEKEVNSIVKIEIAEEVLENEEEIDNEDNELQNIINQHTNNREYCFEPNNSNTVTDSEVLSFHNLNDPESFLQNEERNEKTDQIAHAMSAAGITTNTDQLSTNDSRSVDNIPLDKPNEEISNIPLTSSSNYSKTSINAIALQQALAQILPPPLNRTNTTDNNQQSATNPNPQVLHIVQGKSSAVNQLTLVDNSQQSVLNTSNSTPVLHIVQNKGQTHTTNNTIQSTNTFNGLPLVESNNIQHGSSQLLHIVNTSGQKTNNTSQLLKRVNLLTNLSNVQSGNEQKMVQFVCKSADGKSIHLNAPHQRSMVLRIQPIETPSIQSTKSAESHHDVSTNGNATNTNNITENTNNQQEIKSRSVYEENYAKFIQNSGKANVTEKSTSLPKFNQAFGKQIFQDENQKVSISENHSHNMTAVSSANEVSECQADNSISLDQMGHLNNPPLLLRKATSQATSQSQTTQPSLVQQLKQTITPMNLQTMHGGVIYTRQIPVNIGGGQTINLITVPSTDLIDDSNQKQHNNPSDVEPSIIKIVPQNSAQSSEVVSEENRNQTTTDSTPNPQPQPVLTQMRIKLPMLSKPSQMVSGARVVRPSFFQIQRNVIGSANQPVYQQLVLTAAPPLGQQTIRLPQSQTNRLIKVPSENQSSSESQMSSSTLEQLREFDMVLEQVKERSTVQPNQPSNNTFNKVHTPCTDTTTDTSSHSTSSTESTHQVLYTIGNNSSLNVAYVNRKPTVNTPTVSTYIRSPDSSNLNNSPSSSTQNQVPHTITAEAQQVNELSSPQNQHKVSKISSKSKSRPKPTPHPSSSVKMNAVPPKPSTQKPFEDEQTTQRILYILAEYKEQVENSPDKDKPAPRRRTNPPSNPGSSKRKKSSSSRRPGTRDMSPVHGEDTCRTMGSEDSSCGTSQGDCNESCLDSHSPQDSPRKVVRKLSFEPETPTAQPRPQTQRNLLVADGQTITVARNNAGKPTTAVLMPTNYILPVSMVKSGQQIAIVTNRGPKILTVGGGEGGANTVLLQRLIGPGLKPVLTRPGVRHVRLPAAALQNLQAFTLGSTVSQQPDSTAPPVHPNPPELIDTRATASPWAEREGQDPKPEKQPSPESTEPWNLASGEPHDYSYEEIVRSDNMDRTVLVVHRKDGTTQRHHRVAHVSSAALRHRYAILEHELRLQKSLSEECEDLGVDSPSASELFPEAELLFSSSPAHEAPHHSHTPQPIINQSTIPQPDIDDQIATDQLINHNEVPDEEDLNMALGLDNIVTVSGDGTITLDPQEFARSHPNTTFHKEPTDESEMQSFTIANVKGRHMTSTIFHASRAPATVLVTAPQTTVISQATPDGGIQNNLKYSDTPSNSQQGSIPSVLVKDNGISKFDSMLNRELHLSNTASTIIHSGATQVIRRVCYDDDKTDPRFLESHALMGEDAKMTEDSRDATLESMADVDDDRSSPERNEMFWESNSTSERSEGRRPLDFSSDSDKCCKSPFEETNSTDSSGIGTHIMRLDSVIKNVRGIERSGSADGSSADDALPPLRTYPPKRYHPPEAEERSTSGKTRAGERSPDSMESRRRASNRGVVKRGCHCCNGSPAPSKPKKSRPRKPNTEFTT